MALDRFRRSHNLQWEDQLDSTLTEVFKTPPVQVAAKTLQRQRLDEYGAALDTIVAFNPEVAQRLFDDAPPAPSRVTLRQKLRNLLAGVGLAAILLASSLGIAQHIWSQEQLPVYISISVLSAQHHVTAAPKVIIHTVIKQVPVIHTVYVSRPMPTAALAAGGKQQSVAQLAAKLLHTSDFFNTSSLLPIDVPNAPPSPSVKVAGVPYATGLEMDLTRNGYNPAGTSQMSINTQTLPGYSALVFSLGMGDESGTNYGATVEIYRDGVLYKTFNLQTGQVAQLIRVPFARSTIIKIVAQSDGSCCGTSHVVLGDLKAVVD